MQAPLGAACVGFVVAAAVAPGEVPSPRGGPSCPPPTAAEEPQKEARALQVLVTRLTTQIFHGKKKKRLAFPK